MIHLKGLERGVNPAPRILPIQRPGVMDSRVLLESRPAGSESYPKANNSAWSELFHFSNMEVVDVPA